MKARPAICTILAFGASSARAQTADLHAVAGRPDVWPHTVLIKSPIASPAIAAGVEVKVVGLEGPMIDIEYDGSLVVAPVAQTDFLKRASANLAVHPAQPAIARQVQPAPSADPIDAQPAPTGHLDNALGATLVASLLVFDPTSKVDHLIPGGAQVAKSVFLLLQFGGGHRWPDAMKELQPTVQAARQRGADFETIFIPAQGSSVQSAIAVYRESGFSGPMVDPRQSGVVNDLWKRFGHPGTFALTLVGPKGDILVKTVPLEKGVDKFHAVLAGLALVPKA